MTSVIGNGWLVMSRDEVLTEHLATQVRPCRVPSGRGRSRAGSPPVRCGAGG
jgi:hypothetical protein